MGARAVCDEGRAGSYTGLDVTSSTVHPPSSDLSCVRTRRLPRVSTRQGGKGKDMTRPRVCPSCASCYHWWRSVVRGSAATTTAHHTRCASPTNNNADCHAAAPESMLSPDCVSSPHTPTHIPDTHTQTHTHTDEHTHSASPCDFDSACASPTTPPPPPAPPPMPTSTAWRERRQQCRRKPSSMSGRAATKRATLQIVDVDLYSCPGKPLYELLLFVNGRLYHTTRSHNRLRVLMERIRGRGYAFLRPFPDACDVIRIMNATTVAQSMGDAWASIAGALLHRPAMVSMRKRRHRKQHVLRCVDAFFTAVIGRVEPRVMEHEVANFLWEPIDAKLQPVIERHDDDEDTWDQDD